MKTLAILGLLSAAFCFLPSCASTDTAGKPATYTCPACKDTVQYQYHPIKSWMTTGKEVTHSCPACKNAWSSQVSTSNTCAECNKQALACPVCANRA